MNQDFALSATPSNARRLLLLQHIGAIHITDEIRALAARDMIDESHFDPLVCPYHPVKHRITQFLLDCKLRGVVMADFHPEYNEIALLHAIKLANAPRIHIVSNQLSRWNPAIAALSLAPIVEKSSFLMLSREQIDQHRHNTVLVVDANLGILRGKLRILAQEFAQIIVYQARDGNQSLHTEWLVWANLLFPTMPHPLYPHVVENVPAAWLELSLVDFAPFYNTCLFPDLISERSLLVYLDDRQVMRSLEYSRLLIS